MRPDETLTCPLTLSDEEELWWSRVWPEGHRLVQMKTKFDWTMERAQNKSDSRSNLDGVGSRWFCARSMV